MKYITFSPSAGGALKYILKKQGISDNVVSLLDRLNVWPITDTWNPERKNFLKEILQTYPTEQFEDIDEREQEIQDFWQEVQEPWSKTIWYSSRSAPDLCGLMLLMEIIDESEISLININSYPDFCECISVWECLPEMLLGLQKHSEKVTKEDKEKWLTELKFLRENQEHTLRWLTSGGFECRWWDALDNQFIKILKNTWAIPAARLVGEVLWYVSQEFQQVGDGEVWYRLHKLVEWEKINCEDGDVARSSRIYI